MYRNPWDKTNSGAQYYRDVFRWKDAGKGKGKGRKGDHRSLVLQRLGIEPDSEEDAENDEEIAEHSEEECSSIGEDERKIDPADGKIYNWPELSDILTRTPSFDARDTLRPYNYKPWQIEEYWTYVCQPIPEGAMAEERRLDQSSGKVYTREELERLCADTCAAEDVELYWNDVCRLVCSPYAKE